jgi:hypothetical protein
MPPTRNPSVVNSFIRFVTEEFANDYNNHRFICPDTHLNSQTKNQNPYLEVMKLGKVVHELRRTDKIITHSFWEEYPLPILECLLKHSCILVS